MLKGVLLHATCYAFSSNLPLDLCNTTGALAFSLHIRLACRGHVC